MDFKVGDRVIVIRDHNHFYDIKNKKGTIIEISDSEIITIEFDELVRLKGNDFYNTTLKTARLHVGRCKLLEPEEQEFKIGDKVLVTKDTKHWKTKGKIGIIKGIFLIIIEVLFEEKISGKTNPNARAPGRINVHKDICKLVESGEQMPETKQVQELKVGDIVLVKENTTICKTENKIGIIKSIEGKCYAIQFNEGIHHVLYKRRIYEDPILVLKERCKLLQPKEQKAPELKVGDKVLVHKDTDDYKTAERMGIIQGVGELYYRIKFFQWIKYKRNNQPASTTIYIPKSICELVTKEPRQNKVEMKKDDEWDRMREFFFKENSEPDPVMFEPLKVLASQEPIRQHTIGDMIGELEYKGWEYSSENSLGSIAYFESNNILLSIRKKTKEITICQSKFIAKYKVKELPTPEQAQLFLNVAGCRK